MEATIISNYDPGIHGRDLESTVTRLKKDASYKDQRTVIVTPTLGKVPVRVALSWQSLIRPPNAACPMLAADGAEVGEAYSCIISAILDHPDMGKWKYLLTVEHDNILPADGLVRLQQHMEAHPEFCAISALYFTKGRGGQAQCWGDIKDPVFNFRPQIPVPNVPNSQLIEVNGTGMGMTLYNLQIFRDKKLRQPWFKTTASSTEGSYSQDLYWATDARKNGYRFAVACDVKSSHLDYDGKFGPAGEAY